MEDWLDRLPQVNLALAVALCVVFATMGFVFGTLRQADLGEAVPLEVDSASAAELSILVYVSGAVAAPEVYELSSESIVKDALDAAGGPTDEADLDLVNLALPVHDGAQVHVPARGQAAEPMASGRSIGLGLGSKLNINRATQPELESLPGIGAVFAGRIIEYRAARGFFASVDELIEVKGIGAKTLDEIRDLVTVY